MAKVIIGSARSDERGKITGGKAGDQKSGKEVSTQVYYVHGKDWRVFVCNVPEMRPVMADLMRQACDNNNIGYDQYQRTTLTKLLPGAQYVIRKVGSKCETDCSRLVIDIINCAFKLLGIKAEIPNGNTSTLPNLLLRSGYFEEWKGTKYTESDVYLPEGTILNTKSKGHVVMTITPGSKAEAAPTPVKPLSLGGRILKNGMSGADVKELQSLLVQLADQSDDDNYLVGRWGSDGDFGDDTEAAVRHLQKEAKITVDGEVGPDTLKALDAMLKVEDGDGDPAGAVLVRITGGSVNVRSAPNTGGAVLGYAHRGDKLPYQGQRSENGWLLVEYEKQNAWVSGKYAVLEKG